jgi:hypothetical protein
MEGDTAMDMTIRHQSSASSGKRNRLGLLAASTAFLFGLAGGTVQAQDRATSCTTLAGRGFAAEVIALPTRGASITAATLVAAASAGRDASGGATPATPEHCRVLGAIAPVDPAAPPIRFQLNLPVTAWNGKAVQYGGGGFNGVLITGLAPLRDAPPSTPTPLAQGYATFGTDSGHQNEALPEIQAFALNNEALTNFAYAAYKKTRDVAVALIRDFYGRPPPPTKAS